MDQENFFSLKDRVAVVTGGAQGIGEGSLYACTPPGPGWLFWTSTRKLPPAAAQATDGVGVKCDVSSAASVQQAISRVREALGPIDIVVNNAGITGKTVRLWELEEAEMDCVYAINLKGVFLMCRAVVPEMLERRYGRIVNVASIAGKEGNPTLVPSSSTKAGVIALTKALAKEVAGLGDITVNSISPAVVGRRFWIPSRLKRSVI